MGYRVRGNARDGYYYGKLDDEDLGRVIEIAKVDEPIMIEQYLDLLDD